MPDPDEPIPPGFTIIEGGKLWPLDEWGNLIPTPVQAEQERALQVFSYFSALVDPAT